MNQKSPKLFRSFSGRLTAYILLVAVSIFLFAFLSYYNLARKQVEREAVAHAQSALSTTALQINKMLESVEIAVGNLAWVIPNRLDNPDAVQNFTKNLLENNPFISGSTIAFESNYYPSKGEFFAPFAYRDGKEIAYKQLGNKDYNYHFMDWYQVPKLLGHPYWSEPYFDAGGGNMMMTTYSVPLYDNRGKLFAIFTADVSLRWITEVLNELKPYSHSYNVMIGRGGSFLAHPDEENILKETVFTMAYKLESDSLKALGHWMIDGKQGMVNMIHHDQPTFMFYAPVERSGWSVAVICPQQEIFVGVNQMRDSVLLVTLIGLVLLSLLCFFVIRRISNPLQKFAQSALQIAEGDFNSKLPTIHTKDEMAILRDSFAYMQQSLVDYMNKLQQTTVKKERIESELRIASTIQMGMLPTTFPPYPDCEDIDLYAKLVPAKVIGGDLYDFFLEGYKLYFTVGDVSGKGVPASLLMSVICRSFRTVSTHFERPSSIVSVLNETLATRNESNMFCTLFMGVLDLKTGNLDYCNAGHNPPLLLTADGKVEQLPVVPNLPLGLFEGFGFEEQHIQLQEGTVLFLYTDGVTEAENLDKELYGDERLNQRLATCTGCTCQETLETIFEDVHLHVGNAEQSDDITVLCLKYKPTIH